MHGKNMSAILLLALAVTSLACALAWSQTPPASAPPPAAAEKAPKQPPELAPKVVRWVCTDRICGGCDGQCSRHGHVATHKGGHCACTPTQGSALDQAIRKAFQGHEKGR